MRLMSDAWRSTHSTRCDVNVSTSSTLQFNSNLHSLIIPRPPPLVNCCLYTRPSNTDHRSPSGKLIRASNFKAQRFKASQLITSSRIDHRASIVCLNGDLLGYPFFACNFTRIAPKLRALWIRVRPQTVTPCLVSLTISFAEHDPLERGKRFS